MILPKLTLVYDRRKRASRTNPAQVELKVYADKKQKYISTGIKLLPREWSRGSVNACRPDYIELNEQLHALVKKASEIVARQIAEGKLDLNALPSQLKDELTQSETFLDYAREIAERRYKHITEGTRKQYKVFFDFMEDWKGIVYFSDITEKNVTKMDERLKEKGLKECTRWNYHKKLQMFILQALEEGLVKRNPYSRLHIERGNEDGRKRCLTPAEFHRFETCIIPIERLRRVRDLFVFQTYTMMGWSDLKKFDYKDCEKIKGQTVYKDKRKKTKQDFTIVLVKPALNILKRYANELPLISLEKYNEYLKAAILYAKVDKPISSHWARHTGATILANEWGLPTFVIQHMLGHATIRETERTYVNVMDDTIVKSVASSQRKKKCG